MSTTYTTSDYGMAVKYQNDDIRFFQSNGLYDDWRRAQSEAPAGRVPARVEPEAVPDLAKELCDIVRAETPAMMAEIYATLEELGEQVRAVEKKADEQAEVGR